MEFCDQHSQHSSSAVGIIKKKPPTTTVLLGPGRDRRFFVVAQEGVALPAFATRQ